MPSGYIGDPGSGIGTGSPYQGSGWANFDKFLNDTNVGWGAGQSDFVDEGNNFTSGPAFDNYLIQAGHPAGWEPTLPSEPTPPGTGTVDTTPTETLPPTTPDRPITPLSPYDQYLADLNSWQNNWTAQSPNLEGPGIPKPQPPKDPNAPNDFGLGPWDPTSPSNYNP